MTSQRMSSDAWSLLHAKGRTFSKNKLLQFLKTTHQLWHRLTKSCQVKSITCASAGIFYCVCRNAVSSSLTWECWPALTSSSTWLPVFMGEAPGGYFSLCLPCCSFYMWALVPALWKACLHLSCPWSKACLRIISVGNSCSSPSL